MKELNHFPLEEEYDIIPIYEKKQFWFFKWKKIIKHKIIKRGLSTPMFLGLIEALSEHNKQEEAAMKQSSRRK